MAQDEGNESLVVNSGTVVSQGPPGPQGAQGPAGQVEIYVGSTPPATPNVNVIWVRLH